MTKKTEPINLFITSTKIKQNNFNSFPWKTRTCWWILWSQFFMHRIYFTSWKKEKIRIRFMNFSQKYMGSAFFWSSYIYIYICVSFFLRFSSSSSHTASRNFQNSLPHLSLSLYIYIYIYIRLYHQSLPIDLLNCILCPRRAAEDKLLLVVEHWHVHV